MKKLICALLALTLVLSMTACGGKQPAETTAPETTAPAGNLVGTMEELLEKVIEARPVEFTGGVIPIDLNGTTGFGMANLMDDAANGKAQQAYNFTVETDASNVVAALANG